MYLLDTDICSYFLRGRYGLREKFEEVGVDALHISRVTVAELLVLAHKNPSGRISMNTVERLARTLVFLDIDEPAWAVFPMLKARLQQAGLPRGDFDILQASVAITRGLILVTNNEDHFQPMDVPLANWVPRGP